VPRAVLTLEKKMGQKNRRTDRQTDDALRLPFDATSVTTVGASRGFSATADKADVVVRRGRVLDVRSWRM